MNGLRQDVRYAIRGLRKSPGFTTVAVLTLALGIGANTAVFSVLNAVLLRPLPYRAPEQLAMLWTEMPTQELREGRSTYWNVEEWRRQSKSFTDMAVLDPVSETLTGPGGAEQVSVARVSPNFFALLGVRPFQGRAFSTEEAEQRQRLAVISRRFWQTRLGGPPDALGATIELDGSSSRVVGILEGDLESGRFGADIWEPHTIFPDWEVRRGPRGASSWFVVARLQPGATFRQAQTEMSAIARRVDERPSPSAQQQGISVMPLGSYVTSSSSRLALWMLTGAVAGVLLLAVANIAGLSLARNAGRQRELAIRSALGASQGRIVRQLLIESLTLAVLSGLAGLLVAVAGIRLILWLKPVDLPRLNEVGLDPRAFGWTLAISLLSGILIGLVPATTTTRRNLKASFQEGARGISSGASARRVRRILVAGEFALAIVLLVGAGLLTRSLLNVQSVDPGFRPDHVLSMQLASPAFSSITQQADYYHRVLAEIRAVGAVENAGLIGDFFIGGNPEQIVTVDGGSQAIPERLRLRRDEISPDLFATVGASLIRGRHFSSKDDSNAPRVAIVNDAMARRLWPGRNALGGRFKFGAVDSDGPWITVVGLVHDMRRQGPEIEPIPQMFEPLAQNPSRHETLLVRTTSTDPLTMSGSVQAALRRVDAHSPIYGVTLLDDRLGAFSSQRRFETLLLSAFSVVALLLAAIGVYGQLQYSTRTRSHEIGIRMAVGAMRSDICWMIIREGLTVSLTGLLLGLVGAVALSEVLSSLLFGVATTDLPTFLSVSLLLTAVAAAACYFPARRAARVDPLVALRYE